ncbi:hypothetical protein Tco_0601405 [Tanacetum coccineum]
MLIFFVHRYSNGLKGIVCVLHSNNAPYSIVRFTKTTIRAHKRQKKKRVISFLHVFGALCYPKNDREDIGKLGAKGDIGFFIGYSADSCAYRVYNRRTKKIMETMNVSFDELSAMAFEQSSSKPGLQSMTSGQFSSGLDLTYAPNYIVWGHRSSAPRKLGCSATSVLQTPTETTTTADTAPTTNNFHPLK